MNSTLLQCGMWPTYTINSKDKVFDFVVQGLKETFYGTVAVISADNPSSNSLGGFKESTLLIAIVASVWGTVKKLDMRYE